MKTKQLPFLKIFTSLIICMFLSDISVLTATQKEQSLTSLLNRTLQPDDAIVWYLFHSGWAVKTKSSFLIFDYWEGRGDQITDRSLANGFIDPDEIKDNRVFVFVSHAHGDHYDRVIHEWENAMENIQYIFGWKASDSEKHHHFTQERETKKIEDMEVMVINHRVDGIPEMAFLVRVDSLCIYHSGDHGFYHPPYINLYESNINYLSTKTVHVDIALIMTVDGGCRKTKYTNDIIDGALYTIKKLRLNMMFPMHGGGCEHFYDEFRQQAQSRDVTTFIHCPNKRGDRYFYHKSAF